MKRKNTMRNALVTSIISMLLCVSMLVGTTFAWFTDSVVSANNIIKSGNLDIVLEYWDGVSWKDVQDKSDILSEDLWEPGYVDVAYMRLKNAGSLALKYQLGVNIVTEKPGVNQAGAEFKLSDYIYFDVKEGVNGETNPYANRAAALAEATQKTKISAGYSKAGALEAGSEDLYLALVVHMPTTVGNEANHNGKDIPQIDLGINAYATQLMSEDDSFGKDYDKDAWVDGFDVFTAQDLQAAINNGETAIDLMANIEATESIVIPEGATVALNLNGKTLTGAGLDAEGNKVHTIVNNGTLSIAGGTVKSTGTNGGSAIFNNGVLTMEKVTANGAPSNTAAGTASYAVNSQGANSKLTVIDCNITGRGAVGATKGTKVEINGGEYHTPAVAWGHAVYANDEGTEVVINDGTFSEGYEMAADNWGMYQIYSGNKAKVTVNGGSFQPWDCANGYDLCTASEGTIEIYGGTFAENPSSQNGKNYVAAGYKAVESNGTYVVVPENVDTVILTAADLKALSAKYFTGNNGQAESYTIMLGADIDMNGADFSAIIAQRGDNLTFIGNGYTISNMNIVSGDGDNTTGQASMFYVFPNSTLNVSNLTLKNITVNAEENGTGYAAAVVGYCEGAAVLNNVDVVNATVVGVKSSGALAGHVGNGGTMTATNCDISGTVTLADYESAGHYAGKYLGTMAGDIKLNTCTADVTVSGNLNAANDGAIFGRKVSGNLTIDGVPVVFSTEALQAALDKATSGTTIKLAPGVAYDAVDIKPTAANVSKMVCNSHPDKTYTDAEEFKAHMNDGAFHHVPYYTTELNNVKIIGAKGATIAGFNVASSAGSKHDYILDADRYIVSYLNISNLTFENVAFTGKVNIESSLAESSIEGVTFDGCSFTTGGTAESNGQAIRYYNENNDGKVKNIVVKNCSFKNCRQGVYVQNVNGVTVTGSTFDTTGHNAIGIQGNDINLKKVVIIGNTFNNIGDRVIRFNTVAADSDITIQNNVATNSGDTNGEVMKATSIASGVVTNISGNTWCGTVVNPELQDK